MRRRPLPFADRLQALTDALEVLDALDLSGDERIEHAVADAHATVARAHERGGLSAAHTVVALAGATGSGKSSLTNTLAGQEVTDVGARRPTTAQPVAITWGTEPAGALLDWLGIERRVSAETDDGPGRDRLDGLILVDLPDIDSVRTDHHGRAARLAERVDMLVWVLDPQKYADAVVHQQYLRPMARHAEVTVAVLNQVDTLSPHDAKLVLADLERRMSEDGLHGIPVLGVSATTGHGLSELRHVLADVVVRRAAAHARLAADVATAADALAQVCPPAAPERLPPAQQRHLVDRLAAAAGVDRVARAVAGSYRHRARARAGWPVTRWLGRFRPDPLRRLHLGRPGPVRAGAEDTGPVVAASSNAPAAPSVRAEVTTALRAMGEATAGGTTGPWRDHLRSGALNGADELPDALDTAVVSHPVVRPRDPHWFAVFSLLQWVWFTAAGAGALWLGVLAGVRYLGLPTPWTPQLGPVPVDPPWPGLPALPWPTVLLFGGVLLGVLTAVLAALLARLGAARRRRRARVELRRSVAEVAERMVLVEVRTRVEQCQRYVRAIHQAQS
ncbi:GTPase [Ruania alba]|uniref:50S ribosome-binding GTPase n=1 Tax=Ruania alba TaxID=648782 RepID=A0A1H5FQZ2_9MICO|nr:GTPase [Ruania alba]SEE05853.1 50S ribosome-binding GTPase [Ruania alba]